MPSTDFCELLYACSAHTYTRAHITMHKFFKKEFWISCDFKLIPIYLTDTFCPLGLTLVGKKKTYI